MWFNLAASQGDKDSASKRDTLAGLMTPAQIAEAQKLARGFEAMIGAYNKYRALKQEGRYAEAEIYALKALKFSEAEFGPEDVTTAALLNDLAWLYDLQGRYQEAEPLLKRALAIREKALGGEHSDVASSLNSLAYLYQNQGRYAEAEPLFKRALSVGEKALGGEHKGSPDRVDAYVDWTQESTLGATQYRGLRRYALICHQRMAQTILLVINVLYGFRLIHSVGHHENLVLALMRWGWLESAQHLLPRTSARSSRLSNALLAIGSSVSVQRRSAG